MKKKLLSSLMGFALVGAGTLAFQAVAAAPAAADSCMYNRVCLFWDINYGGQSLALMPYATNSYFNLTAYSGWNDQTSSVINDVDGTSYVYRDINESGPYWTFGGYGSAVSSFGASFNDQASSVYTVLY